MDNEQRRLRGIARWIERLRSSFSHAILPFNSSPLYHLCRAHCSHGPAASSSHLPTVLATPPISNATRLAAVRHVSPWFTFTSSRRIYARALRTYRSHNFQTLLPTHQRGIATALERTGLVINAPAFVVLRL